MDLGEVELDVVVGRGCADQIVAVDGRRLARGARTGQRRRRKARDVAGRDGEDL